MKLSIQITPSLRGGFTAACPSLPGCVIRADTRDQARREIEEAIMGYLAAIGESLPEKTAHEFVEV